MSLCVCSCTGFAKKQRRLLGFRYQAPKKLGRPCLRNARARLGLYASRHHRAARMKAHGIQVEPEEKQMLGSG